jgi:hypothetical protein
MEMEAKWSGDSNTFAEAAEALAIPTELIMAWVPVSGIVIYTRDYTEGEDTPIYTSILKRDEDSILRPTETSQIGSWAEIEAMIDAKMRKRFGEPEA